MTSSMRSFVTPEKRHIEQIVFPQLADAQAAADRIKKRHELCGDIATERGLKAADIDLGTVAKAASSIRGGRRRLLRCKEGEVSAPVQSQFGAVHPDRAQDRAVGRQDASPRSRRSCATDRARSRQETGRTSTTRSRTTAPAAARSKKRRRRKAAGRHFRGDRSGRDPDGKLAVNLPHGADSSAARSPPTSASTTIRSRPTAAMSGTTSPASRRRATALSTRSRSRSSSAGATTRSPRGSRTRRPIFSTSSRTATRSTTLAAAKSQGRNRERPKARRLERRLSGRI